MVFVKDFRKEFYDVILNQVRKSLNAQICLWEACNNLWLGCLRIYLSYRSLTHCGGPLLGYSYV